MWSRGDFAWLAAVLVILAVGFWWPHRGSNAPRDSFSADPRGKKAFYLLTRRLAGDVRRNTEFFSQDLSLYSTICLLGPARYPTEPEWDALFDWVRGGGRLVFAARHEDPEVDLGRFRLSVEEDASGVGDSVDGRSFHTPLLGGDFDWRSNGRLEFSNRRFEILGSIGDSVQVVRKDFGLGAIVVCASDFPFTNESLADLAHDNGRLAFRIFESSGRPEPVAFDEVLNSSGTPKFVAVLLDPPLRHVTLQVVLCAVLFGWWGSRRFGPILRLREGSRRRAVQHAEALGNLHLRTRTGPHLIARYLDHLRRALVFGPRAHVDAEELESVIGTAERCAARERAPNGEVAQVLRRLAGLRARVRGSKGEWDGD